MVRAQDAFLMSVVVAVEAYVDPFLEYAFHRFSWSIEFLWYFFRGLMF